jgi:hypothetical protein
MWVAAEKLQRMVHRPETSYPQTVMILGFDVTSFKNHFEVATPEDKLNMISAKIRDFIKELSDRKMPTHLLANELQRIIGKVTNASLMRPIRFESYPLAFLNQVNM